MCDKEYEKLMEVKCDHKCECGQLKLSIFVDALKSSEKKN